LSRRPARARVAPAEEENRVQIEYTGRHTDITPKLRALAERRIGKLEKVLHGITSVHVILAVDKHRHTAEVTVHSARLDLAAIEESGDLTSSISTVMDKLIRQAQKRTGKLRERKRRSRTEAVWSGVLAGGGSGVGNARVVRSQRFVAKPMTVDEAVVEVGSSDDGLLVFRDADTERLNVLYRRKDGKFLLIEPES
jgi:putative sigma-54 modulation protein